nr:efflux RND transporter periplasmic adaptor subunit [Thiocapsa imhoffii]
MLVLSTAGGGLAWYLNRSEPDRSILTLYGNIDIRQVQLAFNDADRITEIHVEEGDRVTRGQLVASLDLARFQHSVALSQADLAARQATLDRLRAGSRPQEIAQAQDAVDAAEAALRNAQGVSKRQQGLAQKGFVSAQELDDVAEILKTAEANLKRTQEALELARLGPRVEEINAAAAEVQASQAALALAEKALNDAKLMAPEAGVIENRILQVGDMASPQIPVVTIALDDPVWARVYVPEPELGHLQPGMRAEIFSDSFPNQPFPGWIGSISPTAEFTPKSVQTTELRTQLVYRVRVFACNPEGRLRLGMPVTVHVPMIDNPPRAVASDVCQD